MKEQTVEELMKKAIRLQEEILRKQVVLSNILSHLPGYKSVNNIPDPLTNKGVVCSVCGSSISGNMSDYASKAIPGLCLYCGGDKWYKDIKINGRPVLQKPKMGRPPSIRCQKCLRPIDKKYKDLKCSQGHDFCRYCCKHE